MKALNTSFLVYTPKAKKWKFNGIIGNVGKCDYDRIVANKTQAQNSEAVLVEVMSDCMAPEIQNEQVKHITWIWNTANVESQSGKYGRIPLGFASAETNTSFE